MTTENLISLSSSATRELENDIVSITFRVIETGKDANVVQDLLRDAVKSAFEVVASNRNPAYASTSTMSIKAETDSFQVEPTTNNSGKITGYQGIATVTVSSADAETVVQIATEIKTMTVATSRNSTSRELKASVEGELIAEAIADFNAKADAVAAAFGYKGWTIANAQVRVDGERENRYGGVKAMMMEVSSIGGASGPTHTVETGRSKITSNVSGQIILSKARAK